MRSNPQRRVALLDAAIDVLAGQGARRLTFRAVDTAAGVPIGTTSNYFANRAALLTQAAAHVHVRLAPATDTMAALVAAPPTRDTVRRAMRDLFDRVRADRASYLALLELRLEATRREEVRQVLAEVVGSNIRDSIEFHVDGGYPGGQEAVTALYLAMSGLLVEHLTLPELWPEADMPALIDQLTERIVPD